jgi:hypothetical protein
MGGVVNVAIRFKDGRAVCQERWTIRSWAVYKFSDEKDATLFKVFWG